LKIREEFDRETIKLLAPFKAKVAAYAGYMSIATNPLIEGFLGVNVHPADLSIEIGGKRKYVGAQAVQDAIWAGESSLRSTTHIIEPRIDEGPLLMISPPLPVNLKNPLDPNKPEMARSIVNHYQEQLKETGDWIIFPRTLQYLAEGRYAQDEGGKLFFDGRPIPCGLKLDQIDY
jgi:phosphoribosylglycinamide formyltransferase-1